MNRDKRQKQLRIFNESDAKNQGIRKDQGTRAESPDAFIKEFGDEWTVFLLNDGDSIECPGIGELSDCLCQN